MSKIEICFSPRLYPVYEEPDAIVVVVDVFRATSTICGALGSGAKSVIPVETIEEAKAYKDKGYLVGGERNVMRVDFADFGNTPSDYSPDKVKDQDIVISTTNGTRAIEIAKNCYSLVIGSFSNLSAVANYCLAEQKNVLVLCSGWRDRFNIEDTLFGGALADILKTEGNYSVLSDSVQVTLSMWHEAKADVGKYIERSEHYVRLKQHNLLEVARYCLQTDTEHVLPIYDKETKRLTDLNRNR
ncbi:2-phosphosulfolactate phosphatase [Dysgonomonas sp. PH5-45]|uniref:2-phosphosulfolactate phosphatase n=1 Tax=unclassified Dysgonomonas TaxID=2630389 RepID=UPI002473EFF8|nr:MULTISPECIES: 2-phosphosulfolactate phosphatase [unclassified Dysgonomonas]MDH6354103.1 2-phosphosulfolactate phosphatase [Dysgonomonas sp. PH5-45]MDH6387046.1 2-phosphosulfolactate phosphatase [Dysgonomonas sp. PH5-37]